MSVASNNSIEAAAKVALDNTWFQIYGARTDEITVDLVRPRADAWPADAGRHGRRSRSTPTASATSATASPRPLKMRPGDPRSKRSDIPRGCSLLRRGRRSGDAELAALRAAGRRLPMR
jgi:hypothetical protein